MKIAVIGGGPAGLYFSLLAKKHDPSHRIRVYEQNPADATYGWGVVFSDIGLNFLREADAEFFTEFTANHERCDYLEIVHQGTHVQLHNNHFSRTARIDMLNILQRACQRAGVEIEYGKRIDDASSLSDADMIVASDGGNSVVRKQFAEHFQPSFESRRNKFAWYGTRQLFHPVSLIFRESEHGIFIAHSYQYSPTLSTFLVEVDPDTWQPASLSRRPMPSQWQPNGSMFDAGDPPTARIARRLPRLRAGSRHRAILHRSADRPSHPGWRQPSCASPHAN